VTESDTFRAGFAALVGRPNVGKSTLLNALVGEKLSIVTPRPQTTRHRITGLVNRPNLQIAFVDTPGLHVGGKRALNKAMNRTAASALADADLVVPFMAELTAQHAFLDVVPVSSKQGDNLEPLIATIAKHLPESPQLFDEDDRTDRDLKFRITEIIREKLTLELNQEVPYGIAVEIEKMDREEDRQVIHAVIWVDREGQKPIVIGAGGARLKRVGTSARREIVGLLGGRCHLELWVKVRENWADNAQALRSLGLE
jgi:GTP-binding protein Era